MTTVTDVNNNETNSHLHNAALPLPEASTPPPSNYVTNLDSFLASVTPIVNVHRLSHQTNLSKEAETETETESETETEFYYTIEDLWESFQEWSAYGAGVPFLLNGVHPTTQYYVPFLSGIQLYVKDTDKSNIINVCQAEENNVKSHQTKQQNNHLFYGSSASLNLNCQKLKQVTSRDNETEACGSRGKLAFEYMENDRPYNRKPLSDKASVFGSRFPELSSIRSCDLLPSSWICVAWYPIYRIPMGPTLEDLEASFLTLHSLSIQPQGYNEAEDSSRNSHGIHGELDFASTVRLPVIGLASYKLSGSIISSSDPYEREQEYALLMAARDWIQNSQAALPDYQFFINRYT